MSDLDIIRAWKDKAYRNSLNADQLAQLPEHPAGTVELTDDELSNVDGGTTTITTYSIYVSVYITIVYCTIATVPSCCPCPPPPLP
jgi:mersacidin/lichenicidin family type 2 lantibiotic